MSESKVYPGETWENRTPEQVGLGSAKLAELSGFVGGLGTAFALGVLPFVGVDALKVVIASAALSLRDR